MMSHECKCYRCSMEAFPQDWKRFPKLHGADDKAELTAFDFQTPLGYASVPMGLHAQVTLDGIDVTHATYIARAGQPGYVVAFVDSEGKIPPRPMPHLCSCGDGACMAVFRGGVRLDHLTACVQCFCRPEVVPPERSPDGEVHLIHNDLLGATLGLWAHSRIWPVVPIEAY